MSQQCSGYEDTLSGESGAGWSGGHWRLYRDDWRCVWNGAVGHKPSTFSVSLDRHGRLQKNEKKKHIIPKWWVCFECKKTLPFFFFWREASLTIVLSLSWYSIPLLVSARRTFDSSTTKSLSFQSTVICSDLEGEGCWYLPAAAFLSLPEPQCEGPPGTLVSWTRWTHSLGATEALNSRCHFALTEL